MNDHLYTYIDPPNHGHLDRIVRVLRDGGVIAMPTGTNCAFAASPASKKANLTLRRLKPDHPKDRPFALLCGSISSAAGMTRIDGRTFRVLNGIWPGPYTVLLASGPALPRLLKTKRAVLGVKVPDDALAMAILETWGGPLVVTTVPPTEQGPVTMGFEVHETWGHVIELVVDLGEPLPGTETTVLDMSDGGLEIVRVGAGDVSGL